MKIFTVEEANQMLPRARRIVARIQQAHRRVASMGNESRLAAAAASGGGGGMIGGAGYVQALMELTARTNDLDELGIQLKDYERGLIDFPCLRDGRVVLLCWQMGEGDFIEWWHEMDAGFAGRQRL